MPFWKEQREPWAAEMAELAAAVEDAKRIIAAGMDLGGVEYLVNARTGEATFYDVKALSNLVANLPEVSGRPPNLLP